MKTRTIRNYDYTKIRGERFTMPSQTVPDLTMSVREIFDRYARGAVMPGKTEIWDDDPELELPDLYTLDLVDRAAVREKAAIELDNLKKAKNEEKSKSKSDEKSKSKSDEKPKSKSDEKAEDVSGEQSPEDDGERDNG